MPHNWQNTGYQKGQFFDAAVEGNAISNAGIINQRVTVCPLGCGQIESPFHFMTCPSSRLCEAYQEGLITLKRSLCKLCTTPFLIEAMHEGIFCYTDQIEYELSSDSDPLLSDLHHSVLLSSQQEIGWEQFIKGFSTKDWHYIQHSNY
jgi:hypothetical protein